MQCIASTTIDEYRLHFEKDKALARRFQPVWIDEPSEVALYIHVYTVPSYSLFSFVTVAFVEKYFVSIYLYVFKGQWDINYCLINNTLNYLLQREK